MSRRGMPRDLLDAQRAAAVAGAGVRDADPQRPVDHRQALRPVAHGELLDHSRRLERGVDPGDGAAELAVHPDVLASSPRGRQARRPRPTATVAVTAPRRGSISETVPSSALATQTPAAPTARAETPRATGMLVVTGSAPLAPILISVTVPEDGLLAQTTPAPQASLRRLAAERDRLASSSRSRGRDPRRRSRVGWPPRRRRRRRTARRPVRPTRYVAATSFVCGEMTDTVPSWLLATHTPAGSTAIPDGPCPTGDGLADRVGLRVDARHGVAVGVGDPDRAGAGRDRGGRALECDLRGQRRPARAR